MAVPASAVADLVQDAGRSAANLEHSRQQARARDPGATGGGGFDVWTHTATAFDRRAAEDPEATDAALAEGVGGAWASEQGEAMVESVRSQAGGGVEGFPTPDGTG